MLMDHVISKTTTHKMRAAWESASADDMSWLAVNGQVVYGPIFSDETDREAEFSHKTGVIASELHDFDDDDIWLDPTIIKPNSRPTLTWNGIDDIEKYRIYHTEYGEDEELFSEIDGVDSPEYSYTVPISLKLNGSGGVWHFFRVEAVDQYGNESTRLTWNYWVYDLPAEISGLYIENGSGSGLFDITITV